MASQWFDETFPAVSIALFCSPGPGPAGPQPQPRTPSTP